MANEAFKESLRLQSTALRTAKKEELLLSKRALVDISNEEISNFTIDDVKDIGQLVKKSKPSLDLLRKIKKLGQQGEKYISTFIRVDGALSSLVSVLASRNVQLQLEAVGCFINLSCGEHETCKIISRAAAAYLLNFLNSSNPFMQDLCAWALGNIASDCAQCRDFLHSHGFLQATLPLLQSPSERVRKSAAYSIVCYFCHAGYSQSALKDFLQFVQLKSIHKEEVTLPEILKAIFYNSCHSLNDCLTCEEFHQLLPELFVILNDTITTKVDQKLLVHLLIRIFANTVSSVDNFELMWIIKHENLFNILGQLLSSSDNDIVKESLWFLGNLTSWSDQEFHSKFMEKNYPTLLISLLCKSMVFSNQIFYVLWNIIKCSESLNVSCVFLNNKFLERTLFILYHVKDCQDANSLLTAKLTITFISQLIKMTSVQQVYQSLVPLKHFSIIEKLISHTDPVISSTAREIIDFFEKTS